MRGVSLCGVGALAFGVFALGYIVVAKGQSQPPQFGSATTTGSIASHPSILVSRETSVLDAMASGDVIAGPGIWDAPSGTPGDLYDHNTASAMNAILTVQALSSGIDTVTFHHGGGPISGVGPDVTSVADNILLGPGTSAITFTSDGSGSGVRFAWVLRRSP